MQDKVYVPLTKKIFKDRITSSFFSVYLTIISIIQAAALSVLAFKTFEYIQSPNLNEPWLIFLPNSIISFITILIVSYEYTWFVGIFRWSPRVWDNIVPFTLGISELIPMFYLTKIKDWWIFTGTFCFVGALAFYNSVHNCKKGMFENDTKKYKTYFRVRNELLGNILISIIAGISCIFISIFAPANILNSYLGSLFHLFLFIFGILILWKGERFMAGLHSDYGLTC